MNNPHIQEKHRNDGFSYHTLYVRPLTGVHRKTHGSLYGKPVRVRMLASCPKNAAIALASQMGVKLLDRNAEILAEGMKSYDAVAKEYERIGS